MSGEGGYSRYEYYRPKYCDPCSLLHDYDSEYYQNCGQFWTDDGEDKFDEYWRQCRCMRRFVDKVKLLYEVRRSCYRDFSVLIYFQCPRVRLCEAIRGCQIGNKKILTPAALVDVCSQKPGYYAPPKKSDDCDKILAKNTEFYQNCGKYLDLDLLKSLSTRCNEADAEGKKAIMWMLYGRCRCLSKDDDLICPDPDEEVVPVPCP
ncbi:hypothetical protein LSH36_243g03015 [Paralvinella palmiformis]|uniref:Uncharacterized protein n=1 Tax=Paralvinella palmiformis TaxID=53620 RepID=A0AAD9N314_9ANNE|nr:hypothetical protein LSH36_243g03015 [Paralvinella palmiformis]